MGNYKWSDKEIADLISSFKRGNETPAAIKKDLGWDIDTLKIKSKIQLLLKSGAINRGPRKYFSIWKWSCSNLLIYVAKKAIELLDDFDEEKMKAPILAGKKRKRYSSSKVKAEPTSDDEAEESDEEDEVSAEFRTPRIQGSRRGFELYWVVETDLYFSLIVLRNPNVKCAVSAASDRNLKISWTAEPPPDEVLCEVGGGLKAAYQQTSQKKGNISLYPDSGCLQQNQALWTKTVTPQHAVFKIPKVSAITETSTEF